MNEEVNETVEREPAENVQGESKAEKFVRLANYRLRKTVERIRQMKNLASANYEYTPAQAKAIVAAIDREVEGLEVALFGAQSVEEFPTIGLEEDNAT